MTSLDCCGVISTLSPTITSTVFSPVATNDTIVSNYYENQKLMEGPLIKVGDYAHFRYFLLYRNGRFCYYELPMLPSFNNANVQIKGKTQGNATVVHLTLTAQHLRGVMILNASLNATSDDEMNCVSPSFAAARTAIADTITPKCGILFHRKNLELNLTGISLTGQVLSWQLRAPNERQYLLWERAFRLALRPMWLPNTSTCLVCQNPFSMCRRPHHCRKCGTCMCYECSVFIPRLPLQGYFDNVRICRDCSPTTLKRSQLPVGTKVLVYGIFPGRVEECTAKTDADSMESAHTMKVFLEKQQRIISVNLQYVELYSEITMSANRIKSTIRRHLSTTLFRTQLNFHTWNILETLQEAKAVQMVRMLKHATSTKELASLVPNLGNHTESMMSLYSTKKSDASLQRYRGVRLMFPLRLEAVMKLVDQFRNGIVLHPFYVMKVLKESKQQFEQLHPSPCNEIYVPEGVVLVVVGDLHGQLEDFLAIIDTHGMPGRRTWYMFNGDFVDRGSHGVEVMLLILVLKLLYPKFVYMNRGNHEERMINEVFGFEEEVFLKYGEPAAPSHDEEESEEAEYSATHIFQEFQNIFILLPLFTIVNDQIFIVHGGLSDEKNVTIDRLKQISHRREIPSQGTSQEDKLFTHLLWSDPVKLHGTRPNKRGAGVEFGPDITHSFCELNNISLIIRSHECEERGYAILHDGLLLTIFSASSYCGSQTNMGAVVVLERDGILGGGSILKPRVVQHQPHSAWHLNTRKGSFSGDGNGNRMPNLIADSWRKKAERLERRTLISLMELIRENKPALMQKLRLIDPENNDSSENHENQGFISKLQLQSALWDVLGLQNLHFLLYFNQLVPSNCIRQNHNTTLVDYNSFLQNFNSLEEGLGVMDMHLGEIRNGQLILWDAIKGHLEGIDGRDLVVAAFDIFAKDNGRRNPHITYDRFRLIVQKRLGLVDKLTEQQIFDLMTHMDQNADGFVDFQEFQSFFADIANLPTPQEDDLFKTHLEALQLLGTFGTLISREFSGNLQAAFERFDRLKQGFLRMEDIQAAARVMKMSPQLSDSQAEVMLQTILASGSPDIPSNFLTFEIFENVFALDTNLQQQLYLTTASSPLNRSSEALWVHTLEENIKHALKDQSLYLKLVFRHLDPTREGLLLQTKFLQACAFVHDSDGLPISISKLTQLADGFSIEKEVGKTDGEKKTVERKLFVRYRAFLQALREAD